VRKLLDDIGLPCHSTLADAAYFSQGKLPGIIDLNQILGSKLLVMTDVEVSSFDGWKAVADDLNRAAEKLRPLGMRVGYHNHEIEFTPVDGRIPMEVLASRTAKDVVLQLDIGNCLQGGGEPVAWIEQHPGRTVSMHCKDWRKAPWPQCYFVSFGQGLVPWKKVFEAAETVGGVEYYLIEQGNAPPRTPMENVPLFLAAFKKLHG
jgi:sugar phosphate isomerase/epimerase